jgi:regulator of sigma E protease
MGLRTGDRPVAVNGDSLTSFNQLFAPRYLTADRMRITVLRDGERRTFTAPSDVISQVSSIESGPQSVDQKFGLFLPPRVGRVLESSAAERVGLQTGDIVLSIGGRSTINWQGLTQAVQASGGDTVRVRWRRTSASGAVDTLVARVAPQEQNGSFLLGIGHGYQESSQFREYGPVEAVRAGVVETGQTTMAILQNFKKIVVGSESFRQNVGGPVIIAKFTKQAAEQGAYQFWSLVAMLSITLAILNILPFPVLDGGHLMFLLYEAVVRREPSLKVRMALQQIGMVILLAFMVFVIINDIMRL